MHPRIEKHYRGVVSEYQELRDQLLDALADEDLAFHPGGSNLTLGALCGRLAETQRAYAAAFRTFKAEFSFRQPDAERTSTVTALKAWFKELDEELVAALDGISNADVENRHIDRGGGFALPVFMHLDVYREAILIFCGKASVYLAAMGKRAPGKWSYWIWV